VFFFFFFWGKTREKIYRKQNKRAQV